MSVEKAIKRIDEYISGNSCKTLPCLYSDMLKIWKELLESMRDLDGEKDQKPSWYYGKWYKEGRDPEVTCWHCGKTFLCDCMDACCRLCGAPFAKERCEEFKFIPTLVQPIPSGYWFIEPKFEWINSEVGREEYRKRKSVGNCFSTEEEAREVLGRLK